MINQELKSTQKLRKLIQKTLRLSGERFWPVLPLHQTSKELKERATVTTGFRWKYEELLNAQADINAPLIEESQGFETLKRWVQGTVKSFEKFKKQNLTLLDGILYIGGEHVVSELAEFFNNNPRSNNPELFGKLLRHSNAPETAVLLHHGANPLLIEQGFDLGCYEHTESLFKDLVQNGSIQIKEIEPWFQKNYFKMRKNSVAFLFEQGMDPDIQVFKDNQLVSYLQHQINMDTYVEYFEKLCQNNSNYLKLFNDHDEKIQSIFFRFDTMKEIELIKLFDFHLNITKTLLEKKVNLNGILFHKQPFSLDAWMENAQKNLQFIQKLPNSFFLPDTEDIFKSMEILLQKEKLNQNLPNASNHKSKLRL